MERVSDGSASAPSPPGVKLPHTPACRSKRLRTTAGIPTIAQMPGTPDDTIPPLPDSKPFGFHTSTASELKERIAAERTGEPFIVYRDDDGTQRLVPLAGNDGER